MTDVSEHKELKASWQNEVEVKVYTAEEVAKHNTKKDCWIIIYGNVYDVSEYAPDHPGGLDPLLEVAGQEATSAYEDVGHSEDAREILQGLMVGVVEGGDRSQDRATETQPTAGTFKIVRRDSVAQDPQQESSWWARLELAAAAVGLAGVASWAAKAWTDGNPSTRGRFSLAQGIMLCLCVSGMAGIRAAKHFQKAFSFGQDFSAFPSRIPSSTPRISNSHPAGALSPSEYRKYPLIQKEELADGIFRFVFGLPTKYSVLGLPIGQHVAVKALIDGHTVVRSYTPVSNNRDLGRLELLIRVYPDGQVGNYLKNLDIGQTVDIRGPKGAMRYRKGMCNHIGMVGGGTGITPLFQVIRAVCEDDADDTKITLIYGNRTEGDILLRNTLDRYADKAGHKFKLVYTLDQPSSTWKGQTGHVTKELLEKHFPTPESASKMLLCGPPGMVNATKKNLVEMGYEDGGSVSKMTDQIFCF